MNEQEQSIEFSGISGRIAGWMMSGWRRRLFENFAFGNPLPLFFKVLDLKGNEIVVDSGCGSGFYSLAVAKKLENGKVISVDISKEMLGGLEKQIKKKRLADRIEIKQGDCTKLPVDDNYADIGIIVAVWHHITDPKKANQELFRVIKSQGRVVAIDFKDGGHHHHKEAHKFQKTFGVDEMKQYLSEVGFVNEQAEIRGRWVLGYADKP